MDEMAAVCAYQQGDSSAFAVLFELHAAYVYRTSYLITRDAARAEDVTQDTFLILAQRLPSLAPGPLRSWLGRVAANLSLNERRRAWEAPLDAVPPAERERLEARTATAGADATLETSEAGAELRAAIAALAPRQRAMVVLRYYGDCSPDEIAAAMGCRPGTVRVPLHFAALRGAGRVSLPNVSDTLHGIRATVAEVPRGIAVSHLTYTVEVPRALAGPGQGVIFEHQAVTDAHGRRLGVVIGTWRTGCLPPPSRRGRCIWTTTGYPFASAPPGTRVTLRLSGLELDGPGGHMRPIRGTWRLPFTMP